MRRAGLSALAGLWGLALSPSPTAAGDKAALELFAPGPAVALRSLLDGDADIGFSDRVVKARTFMRLSPAAATRLRSLMAYNNACDKKGVFCRRINVYSFPPAIGAPLGTESAAYNAEVLCRNAEVVSRYR